MTTAMAAEIAEAPAAVDRLLRDGLAEIATAGGTIAARCPRWVSVVGRGTSDHVATYARYLIETQLGVPAGLAAASVTTTYGQSIHATDGLVMAISQSGRSSDLLAVVDAARTRGSLTVAITNDVGSPLAALADIVLWCRAGPEHAVAATKSYVTCLVTVAALVGAWSGAARWREEIARLPEALDATLRAADGWLARSGIVDAFAANERAIVTSRGYDLATALEIAIKLQETSRMFAFGSSTADLEHGPIALLGPDVPVLAVRPDGATGVSVDQTLRRVREFGADPWIIGGSGLPEAGDRHLQLCPPVSASLAPAVFVLPGLLLAEVTARRRGCDPDRPFGLTKVTITH